MEVDEAAEGVKEKREIVVSTAKKIVKRLLPPHKQPGRFIKKQAARVGLAKDVFYDDEYHSWVQHTEKFMFVPVIPRAEQKIFFSVIVPIYNVKERYIVDLLDSVINQTYSNWELILADGSSDQQISQMIKNLSTQDDRIKYYKFTKNTDISGNTNQGLSHVNGDYIVFCDHDDVLSQHALNEVASVIHDNPGVDMVYSDEDKLSDNGKLRHSPFFKPTWSPHLFLYTNYMNHLTVVKATLIKASAGLNTAFNGSQDYEFLLRLHASSEKPLEVLHIPKVLYHWREAEGSTAISHTQKSYASDAGRRALEEYFSQMHIPAIIDDSYDGNGYFRCVITPEANLTVAVVVMVSTQKNENDTVINHLKHLTKSNLTVRYVDTVEDAKKSDITVEITKYMLPLSPTWLDEIVGTFRLDYTGAVAPRIVTADRSRVLDMGLVYDYAGNLLPLHKNHGVDDLTITGGAMRVRNVDALTGNVIAYRTSQGKVAKDNQYYVVWTPVTFVNYTVFGANSFFNPNLRVTEDDRITVNE